MPISSNSSNSSRPSPESSSKRCNQSTPLLSPDVPPRRKPHAFWLVPVLFVMAVSLGMNTGPKLEIHTQLICRSLAVAEFQAESHASGFLTANRSEWEIRCRRDPRVSSRLAILSTAISLVMGILSASTTAYWCAVSERIGRRPIFGCCFAGFIANDIVFLGLIRAMRAGVLSDYRLLVLPAILEGLTGGPCTIQALFNSYIHDCAPPGQSNTVSFSRFLGVMMAGTALGPSISGKLVPLGNDILIPFYVIVALLTLVFVFSLLVIPESLSEGNRLQFQARYEEERSRLAHTYANSSTSRFHLIRLRLFQHRKMYLNFLKPLTILWPTPSDSGQRGWNLFLIATAYGLYNTSVGAYGVRLQYTVFRFEWGPVETGYFLTTLGVCRVFALLLVIPLLIRVWKHSLRPIGLVPQPPIDDLRQPLLGPRPNQPLLLEPPTNRARSALARPPQKCPLSADEPQHEPIAVVVPGLHASADHKLRSEAMFDIKFARYSIIWDALCVILLVVSPSPGWFITGSGLQALAGSTSPAVAALALGIVPAQMGGQVIASLSVIQTITSNVIGPFIFGGVFSSSVGRFSEAFLVADLVLFVAVLMVLSMVRIRPLERKLADLDSVSASISSSSEEGESLETDVVAVQPGL